MNWFHKLMIVLVAFIAMMTYFAVRSIQTPLDLVTDKYYEEEVNYQSRIDNISNDNHLTDKVKIDVQNEYLQITFPEAINSETVKGVVKLYYAADRSKDQEFKLNIQEQNIQRIDVSNLNGAYSVQIEWSYLDDTYYTEQKLFL